MWVFGRQPIQKAKPPKRRFRTKDPKKLVLLSDERAGMVSANLYRGIQTFKKRVSEDELEQSWETGDWSRTMRIIPWPKLTDDIAPALAAVGLATKAAGSISIEALPPNANSRLRWDMENPLLRRYVTDRTAKLVVGIQSDTQQIIQEAVARSFNSALTPRQVAKQIKGSIGLFPAQERALLNYRLRLEAEGVRGLRQERQVDRYENQLLNYRSKMIARTEMRGATNAGQLSVWREAANQDLIDRRTARRVWVAEGPAPCEDCEEMDGEETELDEPWVMPDGAVVDCPPWDVHPNCYCAAQLIL